MNIIYRNTATESFLHQEIQYSEELKENDIFREYKSESGLHSR